MSSRSPLHAGWTATSSTPWQPADVGEGVLGILQQLVELEEIATRPRKLPSDTSIYQLGMGPGTL
jgi:hypothetical protein